MLIDVFVSMPFLFWLCYRRQLTAAKMAIRVLAIVCLGIWLATSLIPSAEQHYLKNLATFRYVGIAIITLIELHIFVAVIKMVWKPNVQAEEITKSGVPPIIAKLMLLEVKFWKWLFSIFRK